MYFAFEGFDNPNGTNHLALEMIDFLLNQGCEIFLLTSHTTGIDPDIPELLKERKGFTYSVIKRKIVSKKNFIQRYFDGIDYAIKSFKIWKEEKNLNLIILQSTPTVFISSLLLHFKCNIPVYYNSYDLFPDGPYAYGAIKNKILFLILKKMQNYVYRYSEKIIVISDDMKNTLISQGVPENKLIKIANWYDDNKVALISRKENQFINKYNLKEDRFYIQYAGNFGYTFNYKLVLEVAYLLKKEKKIVFQMIGSGAFEQEFKDAVVEKKLTNIIFYPWQSLDIISDVYSSCDIALIPLSKGVINCSYPSKGALLMACGKTVICATEKDSEYCRTMNDKKIGICVTNLNANECVDAILQLYNDNVLNIEIGKKAREYAQAELSSSVNMGRLYSLLNNYISIN